MKLIEITAIDLTGFDWSWPAKKPAIAKPTRLLLGGLIIMLVSACAEPTVEVSLKTDPVSQGKTNQSSVYGREATFSYPAFSGNHLVATTSMVMTDFARLETFESNSIEKRKLQIRFFYPRDEQDYTETPLRLPVINKISWQYLVGHQELSGKRLRYSNYENAFWDVSLDSPISSEQQTYPVLVFSHGYGYNTESYTALLAELASKGYIVVAINHSYGANPSDLSSNGLGDLPEIEANKRSSEHFDDSYPAISKRRFVWAKPLNYNAVEQYLPIWSDDQSFVIEQLIRLNSDSRSMLFQKLDLANLGLFGHSYGGAAAYHTAARDSRVKALVDIDGTIFNYGRQTVVQPFAFIVSNKHQPKFDFSDATGNSYLVRLNQFTHSTFTDHVLWWQWDHDDSVKDLGDVEALTAVEITSELIDDFFARYLLEQPPQWFLSDDIQTENLTIQRM